MRRDRLHPVPQLPDQWIDRPCRAPAEIRRQFGTGLVARIDVRGLGGQQALRPSGRCDRLSGGRVLVPTQGVEDHDLLRTQRGHECLLPPRPEARALSRTGERERAADPGAGQSGQPGDVRPVIAWHRGMRTHARWCPCPSAGQYGLRAGFIQQDQVVRRRADPRCPPRGALGLVPVGGEQTLLLSGRSRRARTRQIVAQPSISPWLASPHAPRSAFRDRAIGMGIDIVAHRNGVTDLRDGHPRRVGLPDPRTESDRQGAGHDRPILDRCRWVNLSDFRSSEPTETRNLSHAGRAGCQRATCLLDLKSVQVAVWCLMRLMVECPLEMIAAHADLLRNLEQGNLAVKVFPQIYPGFPNSMVLSANTGTWRDIAVSQQRLNHEEIDGRFRIRVQEPILGRTQETTYGVLEDGVSDRQGVRKTDLGGITIPNSLISLLVWATGT